MPGSIPLSDRSRVLGTAEFDGVVAVVTRADDRVRAWLPSDASREPITGRHHGGRPVVVLFGEQSNAATHLAGFRIPLGRTYRELAVAVPVGPDEAGPGPATALVRMYADYFPVVWNGRVRYGFGKALAEIHRATGSFVVARPGGGPACVAVHEPTGPWSATAPGPALGEIAGWLSGSLVGWTPAGRRVRSESTWDLTRGRARRVRLSLRAFEALLTDFGPGELVDARCEAFEVQGVCWSLGWPERDG